MRTTWNVGPLLKRLAFFSGIPFLSLLTPFVLLPVLARVSSLEEWAAFAIGQSLGGLAAVAGSFGWNLSGPAKVARLLDDSERRQLYGESLSSRACALLVALLVLLPMALLIAPGNQQQLTGVSVVAFGMQALLPNWYNVGVGRALGLALYDALPRLVATCVAAVLLVFGVPVIVYPLLFAALTIAGVLVFSVRLCGLRGFLRLAARLPSRSHIHSNLAAAGTDVAASMYSTAAVSLVGATASVVQVGLYSAGDRVYRIGLFGVAALSNGVLSWMWEVSGSRFRRRGLLALGLHVVLGIAGLLFLWLCGPLITHVLFGPKLEIPPGAGLAFGIAYLAITISTFLGRLILVPSGRAVVVLVSTIAGAAVGVPAILIASATAGVVGAATALAGSQGLVALVQVVGLAVGSRRKVSA